jgi:pyruvate formate lyase activating enzyme
MQGCPLRCAFCHNPDTWHMSKGQVKRLAWLLTDIKDYLPYFRASGGGVTVSGGEPLLQTDFLEVLFAELKKLDVHRAIDTSGFAALEKVKFLMGVTDLPQRPLALARYLTSIKLPVWIRYVIIPGISNLPADLARLADLIKSMPNVERLELLPYHTLGRPKWEQLGLSTPLLTVPPPLPEEMEAARQTMAGLLPGLKIV